MPQRHAACGDHWGRQIRYGQPPDDPNRVEVVGKVAIPRREVVQYLIATSEQIADVEQLHQTAAGEIRRLLGSVGEPESQMEREMLSRAIAGGFSDVDSLFAALREVVRDAPVLPPIIDSTPPVTAGGIPHFLVCYQRSRGRLMQISAFAASEVDRMIRRRSELEEQYRTDPDVEVVLLASASEQTLLKTHARYFKNLGELTTSYPDP